MRPSRRRVDAAHALRGERGGEVRRRDADEDARQAARQPLAPLARAVQRLVPALEQQPLLRVHRRRLGGRDAEEGAVEELDAARKAAVPDAARHRVAGCRVGPRAERPPLGGHLRDQVRRAHGDPPHRLRARGARGQHRAHARDEHGDSASLVRSRGAVQRRSRLGRGAVRQVRRQLPCARVVEDERAWQRRSAAHRGVQLVAQLDRAERVDAGLEQRRVRVGGGAGRAVHQLKHLGDAQAARRRRDRPRRLCSPRCLPPGASWAAERAQQGRRRAPGQEAVPPHSHRRQHRRRVARQRRSERGAALRDAEQPDPRRLQPRAHVVGGRHARGCPRAPLHAQGRPATRVHAPRERVEAAARRAVVGLAGAAKERRYRREEDRRLQRQGGAGAV